MARENETTSPPDANKPLVRKELGYSIRKGMDWGGDTRNSPAISVNTTRVSKEQRKTGRK